MFWQIAAQTMGFPLERVRLCTTDTNFTPDGNLSAGSRQTYVSGKAVQMAVTALKNAMGEKGVATYEEMKARNIATLYKAINRPETTKIDPQDGHCVPYETFSFGVQMAEVAVEVKTGRVKVLKVTAVYDFGTVINRLNVEGQVHGGIAMGIGYALMERFIYGQTDSLAKFKIPRAKDMPDLEVIMLDIPREKGPYGASGAAECSTVPTAPSITNAIYNACGIRIRDLPATTEKIRA
jgi:aldehyde oxidoreductase